MTDITPITVIEMSRNGATKLHKGETGRNYAPIIIVYRQSTPDSTLKTGIATMIIGGTEFYLCDDPAGPNGAQGLTTDIRKAAVLDLDSLPTTALAMHVFPCQYFDGETGELYSPESETAGDEEVDYGDAPELKQNQQRLNVGPLDMVVEEDTPDTMIIFPYWSVNRKINIKFFANNDGTCDIWLPNVGIVGDSHITLNPRHPADSYIIINTSNVMADEVSHGKLKISDVPF